MKLKITAQKSAILNLGNLNKADTCSKSSFFNHFQSPCYNQPRVSFPSSLEAKHSEDRNTNNADLATSTGQNPMTSDDPWWWSPTKPQKPLKNDWKTAFIFGRVTFQGRLLVILVHKRDSCLGNGICQLFNQLQLGLRSPNSVQLFVNS